MTGWFGLWRDDGAPIAGHLVDALHRVLRRRGLDGDARLVVGPAVLAQSLLRTTAAQAAHPVRAAGFAAVGDVLIEDRSEALRRCGLPHAHTMSDLELLVHCFAALGDNVVSAVGGEYGACLVHEGTGEVTLLRDAFGVRQLFLARRGPWLVASDSIDVLRAHPAVRTTLDDAQVIDFLLFEQTMEPGRTVFVDVDRLPRGHIMHVNASRSTTVRSFELQPPPVDHRASPRALAARWRDALQGAVAARGQGPTTIFLSGGLDSTAIAASVARNPADAARTTALTVVPTTGPDEDGRLAVQTAVALGLSHRFVVSDVLAGAHVLALAPLTSPLPTHDPFACLPDPLYAAAAAHGPVALHGEGGDEIWRCDSVRTLAATRGLAWTAFDVTRGILHGVRPYFGTGLLSNGRVRAAEPKPTWLAAPHRDLALARETAGRDAMWHARLAGTHERAASVAALETPLWTDATYDLDAGATGAALSIRLPMLDRRVVAAALCAPVLPGAMNKALVRRAFGATLPRAVTGRRKAGVDFALLTQAHNERTRVTAATLAPAATYVDVARVLRELAEPQSDEALWANLRAVSLARWLAAI